MTRTIIAALIAAIAIGGALGAFAVTRTVDTTASVDVRVWRRISDGELFISTRPHDAENWDTVDEPLDMTGLSRSGHFQLSNQVTVDIPVSVEVDVPDPVRTDPTPRPAPTAVPSDTPVAGPCCEVDGMETNPTARRQVVDSMQAVIDFALETYELTHAGPITIHISHSVTGLFARYEAAFGETLDELPDTCSFQEGEHIFFGPQCRADDLAIASEWFIRALGRGDVNPTWIGHGVRDYFAHHFADGEVPVITEDRFRRVQFYERARDIRQDRASDDMMTLAMLYAITEYGDFADWLRFYGSVVSGLEAGFAFESVFSATLERFYEDFEEWADHQKIILISTAFSSCQDASESIRPQQDPSGTGAGFPDYRVPLEVDDDGDGIVCEGFTSSDQ